MVECDVDAASILGFGEGQIEGWIRRQKTHQSVAARECELRNAPKMPVQEGNQTCWLAVAAWILELVGRGKSSQAAWMLRLYRCGDGRRITPNGPCDRAGDVGHALLLESVPNTALSLAFESIFHTISEQRPVFAALRGVFDHAVAISGCREVEGAQLLRIEDPDGGQVWELEFLRAEMTGLGAVK